MTSEQEPVSGRVGFIEAMKIEPPLNLQERLLIVLPTAYGIGIGVVTAYFDALTRIVQDGNVELGNAIIKGVAVGGGFLVGTTLTMAGFVANRRGWLSKRDSGKVASYQSFRASLEEPQARNLD